MAESAINKIYKQQAALAPAGPKRAPHPVTNDRARSVQLVTGTDTAATEGGGKVGRWMTLSYSIYWNPSASANKKVQCQHRAWP